MPPSLLFDVSGIDLERVVYDSEVIRRHNLQRFEMEMLERVCYVERDAQRMIGCKVVRDDEFWVRGHIPGRPIFPGVLQLELAAQLSGFYAAKELAWEGFLGFGGVDEVKFRAPVVPGDTLFVLMQLVWQRHGRVFTKTQGLVRGNLVFEASITGVKM